MSAHTSVFLVVLLALVHERLVFLEKPIVRESSSPKMLSVMTSAHNYVCVCAKKIDVYTCSTNITGKGGGYWIFRK